MGDWDVYLTSEVAAWLENLQVSDAKTADLVDDAIYALGRSGPALGRPLVDTITASKIKNLKELRPGSSGTSEIRVLFDFDPVALGDPAAGRRQGRETEPLVCRGHPTGRAALRGLLEGTGWGGSRAMSSYTKWDRDAYIERVGGEQEAEQRRKVLMARQSGERLAEERKRHGLTQAQLAQTIGVTPGRVSQIERGELATIDAVARYVEALGGRLDLIASFGDHTLTVTTTEAA